MDTKHVLSAISIVLLAVSLALPAQAQEDNSGTNPVNFTYDYRMYTEMEGIS